eukprot:TRINITY_DN8864_c0_g1_i5.p1 TRINITY_DN8864_c0_g1~~TRINITY_DN8864_c0_g1_i5.p1  ORF type:complete len:402 (+),score=16.07 TRINITY_DN8864_c0_g1_i5:157-1362(+)
MSTILFLIDETHLSLFKLVTLWRLALLAYQSLLPFVLHSYDTSNHDRLLLPGLVRWDSLYFVNIANHGYQHDQNYAFFPGLPRLIQAGHAIGLDAGVTGCAINIIAQALTVALLPRLLLKVQHPRPKLGTSRTIASLAAVAYLLNPAVPFFNAVYTEALYSLLTTTVVYAWVCGQITAAAVVIAIAATVRSNALVLLGFLLHDAVDALLRRHWATVVCSVALVVMASGTSFWIHYQNYTTFCLRSSNVPSWCNATPPMLYNWIQAKYWNVGFMKYYTISQTPNIALAGPIIILSCFALRRLYATRPRAIVQLGLSFSRAACLTTAERQWTVLGFYHLGLLLVAVLFMNVQVTTRFLCCSSPLCYWYMALMFKQQDCIWFLRFTLGFQMVGATLFSLFLPWT